MKKQYVILILGVLTVFGIVIGLALKSTRGSYEDFTSTNFVDSTTNGFDVMYNTPDTIEDVTAKLQELGYMGKILPQKIGEEGFFTEIEGELVGEYTYIIIMEDQTYEAGYTTDGFVVIESKY